ncbi:DUF4365 domain-containing protein [Dulcicalothrix desertica]|uniref:DUF4365 domain-containing protein n=2 Tax=Dulcicalothrix desertica TaxID=32056 RepID=UPI00119B7AF2|nr:DUF4365 domain-containing protein [Dulcicalothrix desertica]TWH43909.1 uncharacterized protein DUF4365 [Dulcicalothrix desertica PCC 7102]
MPRKKRPKEHIIADLSVNFVEKYIFLCGYSVERIEYDYGYDLQIFTYDENGEIENGQIYVQLKATNSLIKLVDNETVTFKLTRSDLELWLNEPMPCILIIYDAQAQEAYWLYLQAYFENLEKFDLRQVRDSVVVRIPKSNIINQEAIKKFATFKNDVLNQLKGVISHDN